MPKGGVSHREGYQGMMPQVVAPVAGGGYHEVAKPRIAPVAGKGLSAGDELGIRSIHARQCGHGVAPGRLTDRQREGCDLWIMEHSITGQYDGSWVHGLPSKMESQFCDEHLDGMAKLFKSLPSVPRVVVPTVAAQIVDGSSTEAIEPLIADGDV